MGLAFLNKKSWHTGSFKNIEEVWKAKEKSQEHKRRREELKKKLIEEKYSDELKKLQVEAGLLPESALNRMEWMHGAHDNLESKNLAESYLTGRAVTSLKDAQNPYKDDRDNEDVNEDFVKLQEDPLFHMKKEREKRRQEILSNPMQMQTIVEEIEALNRRKKDKKDKKHKKHKRKRSRSRSRSSEKNKNRDRSNNHKERHDKKEDKKKHSKSKKYRDSSSSSRSSSSRSKDNHRSHKRGKDREHESTSAGTDDDKVFNEFVKKRLGPLVEFDEDSYKLKFTARDRFKTNEKKKPITQEEREKALEQMKRNAEAYEKNKLEKYKRNTAHDQEEEKKSRTGGYLQKMHKDAMADGGRNSLADNMNRGRFFHDKKLTRDD